MYGDEGSRVWYAFAAHPFVNKYLELFLCSWQYSFCGEKMQGLSIFKIILMFIEIFEKECRQELAVLRHKMNIALIVE